MSPAKHFRELEKDRVVSRVPSELADKIRERAYLERRSVSYVVTEIVARGLGLDPVQFGIAPPKFAITPSEPSQN